ncbi:phospho-N-acetylmuramoyl-pentapeptide-transferase [Candidatus Parcubacteria bacterium]|nr:MAG: phospho-N-acetylmuramoyl-pentapeptide-transferase [Candidatus Parcubacteria bacterium]
MEKVFGFAILSFFISSLLLVPFIDFLYKIKLQRKKQTTRDVFNQRTKIFDSLNQWKVGTPFGGGILIIFVVTILTLWAYGLFGVEVKFWELFVLLFSFAGFGILGLYDDLKKLLEKQGEKEFFGLRFLHKFGVQCILALIISLVLYYKLGYSFIYLHWFGQVTLGFLYVFFASFVIVSFVNAFNITDGLDGLAPGLFIICLIAFLTIARSQLDSFLGIFIAILMGSVAAFLYFNIYRARIWLGDVGSLSLGAALAVIGLLTGKIVAIALIGGVFVLEVGSSLIQLISKKFFKKKIMAAAPLHLYFLKKGWEEPKIVMRAWLAGFFFALLGLYLAFLG